MAGRNLVTRFILRRLDNYCEKYIEKGSVDPLLHVCFGGMAVSYLIALPEELRHLEHAKHAKEQPADHN